VSADEPLPIELEPAPVAAPQLAKGAVQAASIDRLAGLEPRPGVAKPDAILVVDHLSRSFGGLKAVDVEHLEIPRGAITALIGPNGAGKTTLFNLLTGFDRPNSGSWQFDGRSLGHTSPHQVARMGMVRTFQLTKALNGMTVLQNMLLAARAQTGERFVAALLPAWRGQEAANRDRAMALLARFNLTQVADQLAGSLSGGQRKLLEMARALMTEPRLVMLDEPMAGVNPALVQSLLAHITALRSEGMTVVFVEHDMDVVMGISDWVVCMAEGRVISEGPPSYVGRDPAVIDAYLGKHHGEASHV
jgi:neutral amino acid transport system ATP-binding protein